MSLESYNLFSTQKETKAYFSSLIIIFYHTITIKN